MSLTYDEIAEIIKLIDSSSCEELIVETGDIKLVVRRNGAAPGAAAEYVERGSAPVTVSPAAPQKVRGVAPKVGAVAGQIEVTAPMVGTFYRAPGPGEAPFVELDSPVEEHTQVCILEVMKLMSAVVAGVSGVVAEVCIANGEPVQYGDVLFRIRPA